MTNVDQAWLPPTAREPIRRQGRRLALWLAMLAVLAIAAVVLLPPYITDNSDAANLRQRLLEFVRPLTGPVGFTIVPGSATHSVSGNPQGSDDCWIYASVAVRTVLTRQVLASRLDAAELNPRSAILVVVVEPTATPDVWRVAAGEPDGSRLDFRCGRNPPYPGL
jgi:hypothetical protein